MPAAAGDAGGMDHAAQRTAAHVAHAKLRESPDRTDDVENGIDRADLVKVHLLGRHAVHLALGGRDRPERGIGFGPHFLRRT